MIRIQVNGLAHLERRLLALGEKASTKVFRDAGRAALAPVLEDMKKNAGYDLSATGPHMRDSIKITSTSRMQDARYLTVMTLKVGPSKPHRMKALAQEFGTVKQVARPFIRPALDYQKTLVLRILSQEIRAALSVF